MLVGIRLLRMLTATEWSIKELIKQWKIFYWKIYITSSIILWIMLTATDEVGQTTETPIYITIYNWASKDWMKCSGPYQSEWTLRVIKVR